MAKAKPKLAEADYETSADFAFSIGKICGALNRPDMKLYLRNRGITTRQINTLYKAAIVVANAFYVEKT